MSKEPHLMVSIDPAVAEALPGVLNDQIFKKALFRFRTANWYLLSVLWLTINFPAKK